MDDKQRAEAAEGYLKKLIELRKIEQKGATAPYDDQRRVRRQMQSTWDEAETHLKMLANAESPPEPEENPRAKRRKSAA